MRDNSHPLRRFGRPATHDSRVRRGNRQALSEMFGRNWGSVYTPKRKGTAASMPRKISVNWRVVIEHGQVLAIEPGKEFEHVFEGGADPYWTAVEFAATRIKEAS